MKTPQVSIDVWKSLYDAATRFQALAPWDLLENEEIFVVKDPVTGQAGYCSILGSAGQMFALCMYRGNEGLDFYQKIREGEINSEVDDVFAMQNALMADFCRRDELKKEDLAVIKAIGFKPRKSDLSTLYPCFRNYFPGFAPWFVTEDEARWLTFALCCATDLVEALEEDGELLKPEQPGHLLTYIPGETGGKTPSWTWEWQAPGLYAEPPVPDAPLDELRLRKILNAQHQQDSAWETDAFFLSGKTVLDRDRPYYARLIMVAHKQSGFICNVEMLPPEQSPYLPMRQVFMETIEKHGVLPNELHVRDEIAWEILKPLTDKLGIRLRLKRHLPAIFAAKSSLVDM